eukprot:c9954_g1_i1.p1 GENE.c9954_g1_i1~~c9954_g1_i1.p1  ORF type:complete len:2113 (-),score=383.06 c9954_g1_i1:184-6522(-)
MESDFRSFLSASLEPLADSLCLLPEPELKQKDRLSRFLVPCLPLFRALHDMGDALDEGTCQSQCEKIVGAIEEGLDTRHARNQAQDTLMKPRVQDGILAAAYLLQKCCEKGNRSVIELIRDSTLPIIMSTIRLLSMSSPKATPRLYEVSKAMWTAMGIISEVDSDYQALMARCFCASLQRLTSLLDLAKVKEKSSAQTNNNIIQSSALQIVIGMLDATSLSKLKFAEETLLEKTIHLISSLLLLDQPESDQKQSPFPALRLPNATLPPITLKPPTIRQAAADCLRSFCLALPPKHDWEGISTTCIRFLDQTPKIGSALQNWLHESVACLRLAVACVLHQDIRSKSLFQLLHQIIEGHVYSFEDPILYIEAITTFVHIARRKHEFTAETVDLLKHCLLDPDSYLNSKVSQEHFPSLKTFVITQLTQVLQHELKVSTDMGGQNRGLHLISETVIALLNPISVTRTENSATVDRSVALIEAVGSIACTLNHPKIAEQARRFLMDQYARILGSLRSKGSQQPKDMNIRWVRAILTELANVALVVDESAHEAIVAALTDNHKESLAFTIELIGKNQKDVLNGLRFELLKEVPLQLQRLAERLTDDNRRKSLLRALLVLVSKVASHIKATPRPATPSMGVIMKPVISLFHDILPPISKLMSVVPVDEEDDGFHNWRKSFRLLWFQLTQFHEVDPNPDPKFTEIILEIARHTPVLIGDKETSYLQIEVEFSTHLESASGPNAQHYPLSTDFAAHLVNVVSQGAKHLDQKDVLSKIRTFRVAACAWLLSVYRLETARVQPCSDPSALTIRPILQYIKEPSIAESESYRGMEAIADRVADTLVETLRDRMAPSAEREQALQDNVLLLIRNSCSHLKRIRIAALKYLDLFLTRVPHLYFSKRCVELLLSCVDAVGAALQSTVIKAHTHLLSWPSDYDGPLDPSTPPPIQVSFPDDTTELYEMFTELSETARKWLSVALETASSGVQIMLADYLSTANENSFGASLVMTVCSQRTSPNQDTFKDPSMIAIPVMTSGMGTGLRGLKTIRGDSWLLTAHTGIRAQSIGEIRCMCEMMVDSPAEVNLRFLTHTQRIIQELRAIVVADSKDYDLLSRVMHRAVALMIRSWRCKHVEPQTFVTIRTRLLSALFWIPSLLLDPEAMKIAIRVWRWVLYDLAPAQETVVYELCALWRANINSRIGLFMECPDQTPAQLSAGSVPPRTKPSSYEAQLICQTQLIMFLFEIMKTRMTSTSSMHAILWVILRSLSEDVIQTMSHHPVATSVRFRLLVMALHMLQIYPRTLQIPSFVMAVLQNRVLNCAVQYFENKPEYHEIHFTLPCGEPVEAITDDTIALLISFCNLLNSQEQNHMPPPHSIVRGISSDQQFARDARDADTFTVHSNSSTHDSRTDPPEDIGLTRLRFFSVSQADYDDVLSSFPPAPGSSSSPVLPQALANTLNSTVRISSLSQNQVQPVGAGWVRFDEASKVILLMASHEIESLCVWRSPTSSDRFEAAKKWVDLMSNKYANLTQWLDLAKIAYRMSTRFCLNLVVRFMPFKPHCATALTSLIRSDPAGFMMTSLDNQEAAQFILENLTLLSKHLHLLTYFDAAKIHDAIYMIKTHSEIPSLVRFALRSLQFHPTDEVLEFMPQLLQSLKFDTSKMVEQYLVSASVTSPLIAHRLIWLIQAEGVDKEANPNAQRDEFQKKIDDLRTSVETRLESTSKQFAKDEFSFFDKVNVISGILKPVGAGEADKASRDELRKDRIKSELLKIGTPPTGVYLPTSPHARVVGIDYESGIPLQSAAKVPIMVTFFIELVNATNSNAETPAVALKPASGKKTISSHRIKMRMRRKSIESLGTPAPQQSRRQACIFKVGDDCRQDQLALQMIRCFRNAFQEAGLDLYMYPYNVVSTGPGCGVIEVVPNSKSLDQIGKFQENLLYDHFIKTYGSEDQMAFQEARRNFVKSMAAYAVISYILQIKDRHNGNILLDEQGHVVHIDFGFIYEISPAHDIGFEMAPFKLTGEMMHVMGDPQSNAYEYFRTLCIKGYLVARRHMNEILAIAEGMSHSGLPCFKFGSQLTIRKLRERFSPNCSERQAAEVMKELIRSSASHITTNIYDWVQHKQQGIRY